MKVLPATLLLLLVQLAPDVLAVPSRHPSIRATTSGPTSVGLMRKRYGPANKSSVEEWGVWAKNQRDILHNKYAQNSELRRSSGENL